MEFMEVLKNMNVNSDETLRRMGGSEAFLKKFLLKFPDDKAFSSLVNAMEQMDYEAILNAAHTLKGVSANLGMENLSKASAAMVDSVRGGTYEKLNGQFAAVKKEHETMMKWIDMIES